MLNFQILILFKILFVYFAFAQEDGQVTSSKLNSVTIHELFDRIAVLEAIVNNNTGKVDENTLNSMKQQIGELQSFSGNLQKKYDDLIKEILNNNATEGKYNELLILYETTQNKTNTLEKLMNQKTLPQLTEEIVFLVNVKKFKEANQKLAQLQTEDLSTLAINVAIKVYNTNSVNFNPLFEWSISPKNSTITYHILSALWSEMLKFQHFDLNNLITLYKTLTSEVISKHDVLENNASNIQKQMHQYITPNAAKKIGKPILDGSYEMNEDIKALLKFVLLEINEEVSDETVRKVIDDVFSVADKYRLVNFLFYERYISQAATAMIHIFGKLQKNGDIDNSAIMKIGNHLKVLLLNYKSDLSANYMNRIKATIKDLPQHVRSLFFCKSFHFLNVRFDKYLTASNEILGESRRYTYTGIVNPMSLRWRAEHVEESTFRFFTTDDPEKNEYMYTANLPFSQLKFEGQRQVFTWVPRNTLSDKFNWIVELHGNEVLIKNKEFPQYLCANGNNNYVFTKDYKYLGPCRWTLWPSQYIDELEY